MRADRDATKKERKRRKSEAHKGATLAFQADKKKPRGDRMTAAELCQRFSVLNELSPKSELKPKCIRQAVQAGKAGESPNTQGRKPMVSRALLDAAMAKGDFGQTVGVLPSSKLGGKGLEGVKELG